MWKLIALKQKLQVCIEVRARKKETYSKDRCMIEDKVFDISLVVNWIRLILMVFAQGYK